MTQPPEPTRTALTNAARTGHQRQRLRHVMTQAAQSWGGEHMHALQLELESEIYAARTELHGVSHPEWWEKTRPAHVAHLWALARSHADTDPTMRATAHWLATEIIRRYSVDPEPIWQATEDRISARRTTQEAPPRSDRQRGFLPPASDTAR